MVEGNRKRLKAIIEDLQKAYDDNDDATTFIYIVFKNVTKLLSIAEDCHFRPEVNS